MRLRNAAVVREELALASEQLALAERKTGPGGEVLVESYRNEVRGLQAELAQAGVGGLQVVLDGQGVHDHTISSTRLADFLVQLRDSVRNVAASDLRAVGDTFTAAERMLTDIQLASTFDGSFGLNMTAPPPPTSGEQLDLTRPTLFDRSVERVVRLLESVKDEDSMDEVVLEHAADLSANAISALTRLVRSMASSGAPTRFAWHGTLTPAAVYVTLVPSQAQELAAILDSVEPVEEALAVRGELTSVDSHDGSFHVVTSDGVEYRGTVGDGMMQPAISHVYQNVTVDLVERSVKGRFARRSKPKYTLVGFPLD